MRHPRPRLLFSVIYAYAFYTLQLQIHRQFSHHSQKQQVISGHLPDSTAAPTHANLHALPSDTSAVHGVPGEGGVGDSAVPCLVFPLEAVSTEHVVSVIRQLRS